MPKAVPPVVLAVALAGAAAAAQAQQPMTGAALFAQNCSACHQLTGKGVPGAFPALAGDTFVQGPTKPVVTLLLNGRGGMPSFRADLDDGQIAAILSYVRSAWGNTAPKIETATVTQIRGTRAAVSGARALQAH